MCGARRARLSVMGQRVNGRAFLCDSFVSLPPVAQDVARENVPPDFATTVTTHNATVVAGCVVARCCRCCCSLLAAVSLKRKKSARACTFYWTIARDDPLRWGWCDDEKTTGSGETPERLLPWKKKRNGRWWRWRWRWRGRDFNEEFDSRGAKLNIHIYMHTYKTKKKYIYIYICI